MRVAELIEDLETGDRTMEHLKNPSEPERTIISDLANAALGAAIGMSGPGLAQMLVQQQTWNNRSQLGIQQAQMQNMMGGSPWNR